MPSSWIWPIIPSTFCQFVDLAIPYRKLVLPNLSLLRPQYSWIQNEVMALFYWPGCLPVRDWADHSIKLCAHLKVACPFRCPPLATGVWSQESKSFAQRNPKLPMSPTALGVLWTLVMWWRPVFMFLYPSLLFWVTVFSCVYLISHGWQNSWFQFPALHLKRQV